MIIGCHNFKENRNIENVIATEMKSKEYTVTETELAEDVQVNMELEKRKKSKRLMVVLGILFFIPKF